MKPFKNNFRSKKGQYENWGPDTMPFWILFVILLGITAVFFATIVVSFGAKITKIPEGLGGEILQKRFLYTDECFLFNRDGIKNDVIDFEKFTNERLNNCYAPTEKRPAYKIRLVGDEFDERIISSNFIEGMGTTKKRKIDVNVFFTNEIKRGVMEFEIQ